MNKNLEDYVRVYKKTFSKDYCNFLLSEINKLNWKKHTYVNFVTLETTWNENELDITNEHFPEKEKLTQDIWNVISRYILDDMKHTKSWFGGWQGFSLPRFNRYIPGTGMRLHCDHIKSLFSGEQKGIPVLSIVGSLNDDYEGGEFLMWGEPVDLKCGDVMVFPSNFLYPHSVTPVTAGTRYTFVSWVW